MTKLILPVLVALAFVLHAPAQEKATKIPRSKLLWTHELKAPSYGSSAAADLDGDGIPEVAFGTYYNGESFVCLNGKDGKLRFERKSDGGPLDASVLIADLNGDQKLELVFADSAHGTMWCVDQKGEELWIYKGPSGTDSPPAVADLDGDGDLELVYGTMKSRGKEGRVVALEAKTGKEIWQAKVPGHVQSEPALFDADGDGTLEVAVTNWYGDGKLRLLSGKTGAEIWTHETGDSVYHGISVADLDGEERPEIIVADRKGTVWCLEAESGKVAWEVKLEGERKGSVFGPTTLVDSDKKGAPEIVVCGQHLHLLDAKGKLRWRQDYGGHSIARGCAVADIDGDGFDDLVFGQGTTLRALRAKDGKSHWAYDLRFGDHHWERIDNAPLILDLDGDGKLDVFVVSGKGTSDESRPENYGRAWAIRAGKGKPKNGNTWTTFRGGNRRLGRHDALESAR